MDEINFDRFEPEEVIPDYDSGLSVQEKSDLYYAVPDCPLSTLQFAGLDDRVKRYYVELMEHGDPIRPWVKREIVHSYVDGVELAKQQIQINRRRGTGTPIPKPDLTKTNPEYVQVYETYVPPPRQTSEFATSSMNPEIYPTPLVQTGGVLTEESSMHAESEIAAASRLQRRMETPTVGEYVNQFPGVVPAPDSVAYSNSDHDPSERAIFDEPCTIVSPYPHPWWYQQGSRPKCIVLPGQPVPRGATPLGIAAEVMTDPVTGAKWPYTTSTSFTPADIKPKWRADKPSLFKPMTRVNPKESNMYPQHQQPVMYPPHMPAYPQQVQHQHVPMGYAQPMSVHQHAQQHMGHPAQHAPNQFQRPVVGQAVQQTFAQTQRVNNTNTVQTYVRGGQIINVFPGYVVPEGFEPYNSNSAMEAAVSTMVYAKPQAQYQSSTESTAAAAPAHVPKICPVYKWDLNSEMDPRRNLLPEETHPGYHMPASFGPQYYVPTPDGDGSFDYIGEIMMPGQPVEDICVNETNEIQVYSKTGDMDKDFIWFVRPGGYYHGKHHHYGTLEQFRNARDARKRQVHKPAAQPQTVQVETRSPAQPATANESANARVKPWNPECMLTKEFHGDAPEHIKNASIEEKLRMQGFEPGDPMWELVMSKQVAKNQPTVPTAATAPLPVATPVLVENPFDLPSDAFQNWISPVAWQYNTTTGNQTPLVEFVVRRHWTLGFIYLVHRRTREQVFNFTVDRGTVTWAANEPAEQERIAFTPVVLDEATHPNQDQIRENGPLFDRAPAAMDPNTKHQFEMQLKRWGYPMGMRYVPPVLRTFAYDQWLHQHGFKEPANYTDPMPELTGQPSEEAVQTLQEPLAPAEILYMPDYLRVMAGVQAVGAPEDGFKSYRKMWAAIEEMIARRRNTGEISSDWNEIVVQFNGFVRVLQTRLNNTMMPDPTHLIMARDPMSGNYQDTLDVSMQVSVPSTSYMHVTMDPMYVQTPLPAVPVVVVDPVATEVKAVATTITKYVPYTGQIPITGKRMALRPYSTVDVSELPEYDKTPAGLREQHRRAMVLEKDLHTKVLFTSCMEHGVAMQNNWASRSDLDEWLDDVMLEDIMMPRQYNYVDYRHVAAALTERIQLVTTPGDSLAIGLVAENNTYDSKARWALDADVNESPRVVFRRMRSVLNTIENEETSEDDRARAISKLMGMSVAMASEMSDEAFMQIIKLREIDEEIIATQDLSRVKASVTHLAQSSGRDVWELMSERLNRSRDSIADMVAVRTWLAKHDIHPMFDPITRTAVLHQFYPFERANPGDMAAEVRQHMLTFFVTKKELMEKVKPFLGDEALVFAIEDTFVSLANHLGSMTKKNELSLDGTFSYENAIRLALGVGMRVVHMFRGHHQAVLAETIKDLQTRLDAEMAKPQAECDTELAEQLTKKLGELEAKLAEANEAAKHSKTDVDGTVAELQAKVATLEEARKAASEHLSTLDSKHQFHIAAVQRSHKEQMDAKQAEFDKRLEDLQAKLDAATKSRDALETQLRQNQPRPGSGVVSDTKALEELREANARLVQQNMDLTDEVKSTKEQLTELKSVHQHAVDTYEQRLATLDASGAVASNTAEVIRKLTDELVKRLGLKQYGGFIPEPSHVGDIMSDLADASQPELLARVAQLATAHVMLGDLCTALVVAGGLEKVAADPMELQHRLEMFRTFTTDVDGIRLFPVEAAWGAEESRFDYVSKTFTMVQGVVQGLEQQLEFLNGELHRALEMREETIHGYLQLGVMEEYRTSGKPIEMCEEGAGEDVLGLSTSVLNIIHQAAIDSIRHYEGDLMTPFAANGKWYESDPTAEITADGNPVEDSEPTYPEGIDVVDPAELTFTEAPTDDTVEAEEVQTTNVNYELGQTVDGAGLPIANTDQETFDASMQLTPIVDQQQLMGLLVEAKKPLRVEAIPCGDRTMFSVSSDGANWSPWVPSDHPLFKLMMYINWARVPLPCYVQTSEAGSGYMVGGQLFNNWDEAMLGAAAILVDLEELIDMEYARERGEHVDANEYTIVKHRAAATELMLYNMHGYSSDDLSRHEVPPTPQITSEMIAEQMGLDYNPQQSAQYGSPVTATPQVTQPSANKIADFAIIMAGMFDTMSSMTMHDLTNVFTPPSMVRNGDEFVRYSSATVKGQTCLTHVHVPMEVSMPALGSPYMMSKPLDNIEGVSLINTVREGMRVVFPTPEMYHHWHTALGQWRNSGDVADRLADLVTQHEGTSLGQFFQVLGFHIRKQAESVLNQFRSSKTKVLLWNSRSFSDEVARMPRATQEAYIRADVHMTNLVLGMFRGMAQAYGSVGLDDASHEE